MTPTDNVFCPTGDGGGVDPTCRRGVATGTDFTPIQRKAGLEKLSTLPDAEEGYRHFRRRELSQIRMKSFGLIGAGKLMGQIPIEEKRKKMEVEMELTPDQLHYAQISVTRKGVEAKLTGDDPDSEKFGSHKGLPFVIKDDDGEYHLQSGFHRAAAQILATGKLRAVVIQVKSRTKNTIKYQRPTPTPTTNSHPPSSIIDELVAHGPTPGRLLRLSGLLGYGLGVYDHPWADEVRAFAGMAMHPLALNAVAAALVTHCGPLVADSPLVDVLVGAGYAHPYTDNVNEVLPGTDWAGSTDDGWLSGWLEQRLTSNGRSAVPKLTEARAAWGAAVTQAFDEGDVAGLGGLFSLVTTFPQRNHLPTENWDPAQPRGDDGKWRAGALMSARTEEKHKEAKAYKHVSRHEWKYRDESKNPPEFEQTAYDRHGDEWTAAVKKGERLGLLATAAVAKDHVNRETTPQGGTKYSLHAPDGTRGELEVTPEPSAARMVAKLSGQQVDGSTVRRTNNIQVDETGRGKGYGQSLYLAAHADGGWLYNSQAEPGAERALDSLKKKGLLEVYWHSPGGVHVSKITDAGLKLLEDVHGPEVEALRSKQKKGWLHRLTGGLVGNWNPLQPRDASGRWAKASGLPARRYTLAERTVAFGKASKMLDEGLSKRGDAKKLADVLKTLTREDLASLKRTHQIRSGGRVKQKQIDELVRRAKALPKTKPVVPPVLPPPTPPPEPLVVDYKQKNPDHPVAKAIREDVEGRAVVERVLATVPEVPNHYALHADVTAAENLAHNAYVELRTALKGKGKPEYKAKKQAAYDRLRSAADAMNKVFINARDNKEQSLAKAHATLFDAIGINPVDRVRLSPQPAGYRSVDESDPDAAHSELFYKASAFVQGVTAGPTVDYTATQNTARTSGGGYYDHYHGKSVVVNTGASIDTTVHEFGHLLENTKPGVQKAALEFLTYRTEGLPVIDYGDDGYGQRIMSADDDFKRVNGSGYDGLYTARVYPDGNTEIMSKGVQHLYNDPAGFAKNDPEYFQFVISQLRKT